MVQEHIKLATQDPDTLLQSMEVMEIWHRSLVENVYPFFLLKLVFPHEEANAERTGASPSKKRAVVVEGAESDSQAWSGHFLSHTSQPENVKKMAGMNIASPSFSCRLCIVTYNTDVGCGCGSCQTASPRL